MITLNGVRCCRARFAGHWLGPWTCDVDIDPDSSPVTVADVPVGPVTISILTSQGTTITLKGTVDPKFSGRWIAGVQVRVVAGGGGWSTVITTPQDFQSPSGVSALAVENATAALVGEIVNDPQPVALGLHWVRASGPASSIFRDPERAWYVDLSGVTQVGTWPAATPDATLEILEWDPSQQRATISADTIVLPGTVLTDARFDGPVTVRDVEQIWDKDGTRAMAWMSASPVSRIGSAMSNIVRALSGVASLKRYRYQIVSQTGSLLTLNPSPLPSGKASQAPPLTNAPVWPGMSGLSATYAAKSLCHVVFTSQGWADPIVVDFDQTLPNAATYDTTGRLALGPSASGVDVAGGGPALARVGDSVLVYFPPEMPLSGTIGAGPAALPFTGLLTVPGPGIGSIQTGSALGTCGAVIICLSSSEHGSTWKWILGLSIVLAVLGLEAWSRLGRLRIVKC